MNDMLHAQWWITRASRLIVVLLLALFVWQLAARTPFGPLLVFALALYAAYRIFASGRSERPRRPQRNTSGAERTPVLPGGGRP